MTDLVRHHTEHRQLVAAPARVLYDLVADVTRWPAIFGPTVDVRLHERGAGSQRFELSAIVNGEVARWTSRRTLDPDRLRIEFEQEKSQPPIGSMGGEWLFLPTLGGGTEVVLLHHFAATDDNAADVAWITAAVDRNSPQELAALARIGELGEPLEDLVFSFTDSVPVAGAAADAYEFINRADLWPVRLPHVVRAKLREDAPGVQDLEMETVTADGSTHTTRSIRLCSEGARIVFKQQVTPRILLGHTGEWVFSDGADGAVVDVRHTVALDPAHIEDVLGPGATLADARVWATEALRKNSLTTVSYASVFAEGRRSVLA